MCAPTKDAVYAALRGKGIRAIKVSERIQPVIRTGFAGLRKRDVFGLVAFAVALAGAAWYVSLRAVSQNPRHADADQTGVQPVSSIAEAPQSAVHGISSGVIQIAQPRPRKWLELPAGLDLTTVFKHKHELYLAQYARPGVPVHGAGAGLSSEVAQDFYDNLNAGVAIEEDDAVEIAELKRIVVGMKEDAKKYLTMPNGIEKLGIWLEERQTMESDYRDQYVKRVKRGELSKDEVNAIFSAMGLQLIQ